MRNNFGGNQRMNPYGSGGGNSGGGGGGGYGKNIVGQFIGTI